MSNMPAGIRSLDPLPYGGRRWNGATWPSAHVDAYNRELARIRDLHSAGYDVTALVDGLYHLANQFDRTN